MRYHRALFLVDPGQDTGSGMSVLRRVAPQLQHLLIILPAPAPSSWWSRSSPPDESDPVVRASLADLRAAAEGAAPEIDVQFTPVLGSEAVAALCSAEDIDLLVFGSRALMTTSVQRRRLPVAVLWAEGEMAAGPLTAITCVATSDRSLAALGSFLRDHSDDSMQVALLSPAPLAPEVMETFRPVAGIEASVAVSSPRDAGSMVEWLAEWILARPIELLVFVGIPNPLLLGALRTAPVLLVPSLAQARSFRLRGIDLADIIDDGGPLRVRIDQLPKVGNSTAVEDREFAFVAGGRVIATAATRTGQAQLPAGLQLESLGVYSVADSPPVDPLGAIEQLVVVVRPGVRSLVVFDAELPDGTLREIAEASGPDDPELLAVRLRPTRSSRSIRDRLRMLGLSATVIDARAVLDEGEALDVSDSFDRIRLARVAAKLRIAGFPITAMLHRDGETLVEPEPAPTLIPGNRIELEIHNPTARAWLLDAIASSTDTLHLQAYMVIDDDVGRAVESGLADAGARGVTVRVLVDSLHGLHGSFGVRNPLLERLSTRVGIELRTARPITELPSLFDLKQRDHRKLLVVDGRMALIGGRNLGHEYYAGFGEVPLTPGSTWKQVPWLDAGARVEGPAVEALASAFREAWVEAGGSTFELASPEPLGSTAARVVVHHGLRDAHTLDTYRELIDTAASHVYLVNGFPLVLELQHALLGALRRGVRVRTLFGRLTPTHGGAPFDGSWAPLRIAATELVHSRMDPLIGGGGEAYMFARRDLPGWAPGLGIVHPHVHAKVMTVDGLRCAIGSANMDITAAYWESEVMLVVEDPGLTGEFETKIDALMGASIRVDEADLAWQQQAKRRAWMRHWPGLFSV